MIAGKQTGCSCATGCDTNKCSCRKEGYKCDQRCACLNLGCSNLPYCGCKSNCSTRMCSCQKSGVNCVPGKCKCSIETCLNYKNKAVVDNNIPSTGLTYVPLQSSLLVKETNFVQNNYQEKNINNTQHTDQNTNNVVNVYATSPPSSVQFQTPSLSNSSSPSEEQAQQIGEAFVKEFYKRFLEDRQTLKEMFDNNATLLLQQQTISGKDIIGEKFVSLGPIQVSMTNQNFQAFPEGIGVIVAGKMMDQHNHLVTFQHLFKLIATPDNRWFINQMKFDFTS